MVKYSKIFYDNLQRAYDYFNEKLFQTELNQCMITLQRKNGVFGYYKKNVFVTSECANIHEIALNPDKFNRPINEILSTLVHEQIHLLCDQRDYVSRKGYHSKQWCELMKDVGLQPVSAKTGEDCDEGGAKMTHRILSGKVFDLACNELLTEIKFDLTSVVEIKEKKEKKNNKFIYTCLECGEEAILKRNDFKLICGECSVQMKIIDQ